MNRRQFLNRSLIAGISTNVLTPGYLLSAAEQPTSEVPTPVDYELALQGPAKRFDGKESFCHPRAGIVPGAGENGPPRVVMTMLTIDLSGSDVFREAYCLTTNDLGKNWTEPKLIPELGPREETIKGERRPVAFSDGSPTWHKKSQTLLTTGHTVAYTTKWKVVDDRPNTAYAIYDAKADKWHPWQKMPMGDDPRYSFCGAGCSQRYDLADGTILLPIYFRPSLKTNRRVTVAHCSFDGQTLKFLNHGNELHIDDGSRGLGEPSLTHFDGTYFLTIRHAKRGYVARSRDGLEFEPMQPWKFDDDADLGSYETQQHWVTHSDGLFLVYTRRGLNNDYVFRNRAPLLIAQVDPKRMCVLRKTERELMPNRGARLGNFGVTDVTENETWVTDAEWMQPKGVEKHGSDGTVWVAQIKWARPNRLMS